MSFTQAYVSDVGPPTWMGGDLKLSWTSTAPAGMAVQVYVGGVLSWHHEAPVTSCRIPWPADNSPIDIGHVAAADARTSFAASLPPRPVTRATISWTGGTFLDPTGDGDVSGFRVYGPDSAGGPVDYSKVLATVPAYTPGVVTDGWNMGGYGMGGFGMASASYSWTTPSLPSGTYSYAIVAYGAAGVDGTAATATVTIAAPPAPPSPFAGTLSRLTYSLVGAGGVPWGSGGFGMPSVVLIWQEPPYW